MPKSVIESSLEADWLNGLGLPFTFQPHYANTYQLRKAKTVQLTSTNVLANWDSDTANTPCTTKPTNKGGLGASAIQHAKI